MWTVRQVLHHKSQEVVVFTKPQELNDERVVQFLHNGDLFFEKGFVLCQRKVRQSFYSNPCRVPFANLDHTEIPMSKNISSYLRNFNDCTSVAQHALKCIRALFAKGWLLLTESFVPIL